jgi:hypothetical protein
LNLGAVSGGVGENEAGAEAERGAGGFQGVAARGNVVHEIGFLERQGFAGAGEVVLVGRDGTERVPVAAALGLNGLGVVDGFDNLSARAMHGIMLARRALASVLPLLSGIGTSQQGPVMSAAISRAAGSKSAQGLAVDLMA